jgi:hypothetical protein
VDWFGLVEVSSNAPIKRLYNLSGMHPAEYFAPELRNAFYFPHCALASEAYLRGTVLCPSG